MNLKSLIAPYLDTVEGLGWIIEVTETSVGTYRHFKNGKLRKTPDVRIEYYEYQHDYLDVDDEGELFKVEKLSERPWYVTSTHTNEASTYKYFDRAVLRFLEFAQSEAGEFGLPG